MQVIKVVFLNLKLQEWLENMVWNILKFGNLIYIYSSIGDTSIAPVFDYLFSTIIG